MEQKVTELDQRVAGVEQKVTKLEQKVTELDQRVAGVEQKVTKLEQKVTEKFGERKIKRSEVKEG